ncbi:hypothetical protein PGT21_000568 [Puccinia graminis f. sp. tritici]|uniref:Uncharacterized protein n=1 Tax=Puccinia graminis f. sp. tritici TaxID=56615 RepID=A0A5B0QRF9_PUCGR|nr:hypothetical protein PGT21_000568 [Puccinia graminis f. sp. tritici]
MADSDLFVVRTHNERLASTHLDFRTWQVNTQPNNNKQTHSPSYTNSQQVHHPSSPFHRVGIESWSDRHRNRPNNPAIDSTLIASLFRDQFNTHRTSPHLNDLAILGGRSGAPQHRNDRIGVVPATLATQACSSAIPQSALQPSLARRPMPSHRQTTVSPSLLLR